MKSNLLFLFGIVAIGGTILVICFLPQQQSKLPANRQQVDRVVVSKAMPANEKSSRTVINQKTHPKSTGTSSASSPGKAAAVVPLAIKTVADYEACSVYGPLPKCLASNDLIGKLSVDQDGRLIINQEMRRLFDYFLAGGSEEGQATSIARIKEYIDLTLPYEAKQDALAILEDYLSYKEQIQQSGQDAVIASSRPESLAALKQTIVGRMELRRAYMEPQVVDAFFGREETYDLLTLRTIDLENDASLTESQKALMLEDLETQLPDNVKESRRQMMAEHALNNQIAALQAEGGNEDEIYQLRAAFYGAEKAERLAAREQKRADFKRRMAEYRDAKNRILQSDSYTSAQKQAAIEQVAAENFSDSELRRVRLLERFQAPRQREVTTVNDLSS